MLTNVINTLKTVSGQKSSTSSSESSYKHDCDCFELIVYHLRVAGVTGIVQQYMHMVDAEYLNRVLCPPMTLQYAGANDFQLSWAHAKFSGTAVWPYNSGTHVSIDLDMSKISTKEACATVSIVFSAPLCISLIGSNGASLGNKMMKCAVRLTRDNADTFVNTVFAAAHKDRLVGMLLDGNKTAKLNESEMCTLLESRIFDEACVKIHRKLVRAIYGGFHTEKSLTISDDDHYDIPAMY